MVTYSEARAALVSAIDAVKDTATQEQLDDLFSQLVALDARVDALEIEAESHPEFDEFDNLDGVSSIQEINDLIGTLDARVTVLEKGSGLFPAEVNGEVYTSTVEALEAVAKDGGTMTVLKTESGEPQVIEDPVEVKAGVDVTLDMSTDEGVELEVKRDSETPKSEGFKVEGNMTVTGGTVKNTGTSNVGIHYGVFAVEGNGSLTINEATVDGGEKDAPVVIRDGGGTVTVTNGANLKGATYGIAKYGSDPSTISVAGKVEATGENGTAISSLGGSATILIDGGAEVVSADGPAVALNAGGDNLIISDESTVTGGQAGISVLGGTVIVNGGDVTGTKDVAAAKREWLDGSAVWVQAREPVSMYIHGGNFESTAAYGLFVSKTGAENMTLSIDGGKFTGAKGALAVGEGLIGFITGGEFSSKPDDSWVAEGYQVDEGEGTWTVSKIPPVATVDGTDYTTIESAMAALHENSVMVLGKPLTVDEPLQFNVQDVTLDLNNFDVTAAGVDKTEAFMVTAKTTVKNGKVTCTADSLGEKYGVFNVKAATLDLDKVEVDAGSGKASAVVFSGTGTVNVLAGTYLKASLANTVNKYNAGAFQVNVYGKIENTSGYCAIAAPAGGSVFAHLYSGAEVISAEGSGVLSAVYGSRIDVDDGAKIEGGDCGVCLLDGLLWVTGGEISAKTAGLNGGEYKEATDTEVWCDGSAVYAEALHGSTHIYMNIAGGTFTSAEGYAINLAKNTLNNISLDITGGTFTGKAEKGSIHSADESIKGFVKGGTFSPAVSSEFIAEGFENQNGTVVATVAE